MHHVPGLDAAERADVRADADVELERRLRLPDTEVVSVTEGTRAEALAELRRDPDVEWAETDDPVKPFTTDTLLGRSCGGCSTRARAAASTPTSTPSRRGRGRRGAGITVGVVDTGVQAAHADLGGRVATGFNTVTNTTATRATPRATAPTSPGSSARARTTAPGVAGIAPERDDPADQGLHRGEDAPTSPTSPRRFAYAGQHGIPVVNASLGGSGTSTTIDSAMATYPNTLYVIAAGNNGTNNDVYPVTPCVTSLANELCVGASTINDVKASFSNYGASTVDLFAPGQAIVSTYPSPTLQVPRRHLDGVAVRRRHGRARGVDHARCAAPRSPTRSRRRSTTPRP